jgi:tricorn protease
MYAETHFDLSFPMASKPYVIALNKKAKSPFESHLVKVSKENDNKKADKKNTKKEVVVEIDFNGIEHRVMAFDLPLGGYKFINSFKDKVRYHRAPTSPEIAPWGMPENGFTLYQFNFETNKEEVFHNDVTDLAISLNKEQMLLKISSGKLRLVSTNSTPKPESENPSSDFSKNSGWINLNKINLKINPKAEWAQMYREAWILQREHFWTADMSKIEWQNVYTQYAKLLPRIKTRSEFSDLIWEMQGELGTSHCYEMMGDYYLKKPYNPLGKLAAKFNFKSKQKAFEVLEIYNGDSWKKNSDSPLNKTGINLEKGDCIYSVDGNTFENASDLDKALLNRANTEVNLGVIRAGKKAMEYVNAFCLASNTAVLYRQWVERNKEYVHKKSNGKIGYLHIPDMMGNGFSEFYRHFIGECCYEGLIVDVRYNGGGHVSQHILKALSQKVIGADVTRWSGVETYPTYGMIGPVVALTNEYAGSDGDIFSHSFKLMKIGKLIGKRTWGGVIGINGQYQLKDRTMVTQPEYSHWFEDVGYGVENYGTDPDIEVDITPEEWNKNIDPQLDESIKVMFGEMKKNPPKNFKLNEIPNLRKPKLPKL